MRVKYAINLIIITKDSGNELVRKDNLSTDGNSQPLQNVCSALPNELWWWLPLRLSWLFMDMNLAFGSANQAPLEATADVEHPLSHMCHIVKDHRPKLAGQSQPKPASSIYSIHCAVSSRTLAVLMPWGYMQVLIGLLLVSKTKCNVCPSSIKGCSVMPAVDWMSTFAAMASSRAGQHSLG